ncbi:uncharacterized protein BXIN_0493 [Babesia sp. Xinjiang]|uniref:uncharacterized protein n=1 Tax=Babesia sp. Xinjiang TaxID=462227 RepID=UPI000A2406EE|nr:uncharacterized protein BXIN_0493 [Babesia sp. Xinjiang]ORM41941.1 hypothetical protein BXIN_0493 [Babesia sp. Xinjiang]
MPRYDLFARLPLLSYVDRIHIRYKPGLRNSETCRQLLLSLLRAETARKYPSLSYTYELLSYDERPEITITLASKVSHRFYADECSLEDIQRAIDCDQYKAHLTYLRDRSLEVPREEAD